MFSNALKLACLYATEQHHLRPKFSPDEWDIIELYSLSTVTMGDVATIYGITRLRAAYRVLRALQHV